MSTNTKLAEALRLAREWFRHEEAGEGPQADDVIKAADEAITAHDAEQAQEAQQPAGQEQDERAAFEAWADNVFYNGLASVSDTWNDETGRYFDAAHFMAWKAWQARAALAQRREPLTDEQIAEGRYRTWAAEPDDAPEAWAFMRGARWAEKTCAEAWGVKLGATTGSA